MVEVLAIARAILALASGFSAATDLVARLQEGWRARRVSRAKLAELEKLQRALELAESTVLNAYETPNQRYGQTFRVGDGISRYILFALAERQNTLLRDLQSIESPNASIQPLIDSTEETRNAAARCLNELAIRTQLLDPSPPLSIQDQATLLMDYQNICYNAVLYRTGQAPHSKLATMSLDRNKSTCRRCRAVLTPRKMPIPGADSSSWVLINLSGLFRAHCNAGSGLTCIWQLRVPSCYGVFPDEKALLQHMLEVHVRDNGSGSNFDVDWPADTRSGNLEKCGYSVRVNGLQMRVAQGGKLVVPILRGPPTVAGVGAGSSVSNMGSPMVSSVSLGYSGLTNSWSSAVPEMDPAEVGERVEMPPDERFELF